MSSGAGFRDKYFLAALIPKKSEGTELIMKKVSETAGNLLMGGPKASLPPATQFSQSYVMYLGPKDLHILKAFGHELDRLWTSAGSISWPSPCSMS